MTGWDFRSYQNDLSNKALTILDRYAIVYLAMEERTGKTGTAIALANKTKVSKVLIITKAVAVEDWKKQLGLFQTLFEYEVVSYHSAHKSTIASELVILDESHNFISAFPKTGKMWKVIKSLTIEKPIVYISATPHAQGYQMLYHQFKLSSWSPWSKFKDFYSWYKNYAWRDRAGNTHKIWLHGRNMESYAEIRKEEVKACVDHLFITATRKSLGFKYEPSDKVHYIDFKPGYLGVFQKLLKDKLIRFTLGDVEYEYIADTVGKLRTALHQLEGGTLKVDGTGLILGNTDKIDFIKKTFGDTNDMAIMYYFQAEEDKLHKSFKNASILQSTRYAEGYDLSHVKHLIIYSQDYSTAKHTQRRARQASKARDSEIIVHHIIKKGGVSEGVYKTVVLNKKNFVDSRFNEGTLDYA